MRRKTVKKTQKGFLFHLGNLFIVLSLLSFFLFFYPVIKAYLFPPQIKQQKELKGNFLTVPKISAQAPVLYNVDPWKENIYKPVLKKGVAHAKGSAMPGQRGSVFIFAHSSGNPLEITNYNTVFLRLGELKKGDDVLIRYNNKTFKYKVTGQKIVWPNEVGFLTKQTKNQLILQTCWPIGTSLKRLLVFAAPTN
ncbi:MAG: sortase [Microgenomates group bacterium GW2011_GWA2_37_6]|nr:MAG: sortase [Microgenomates group bacterium GW2011_GWA2_37_6]